MVPAGNKAKRLLSVNHTTKTNHHHYHHHHHQEYSIDQTCMHVDDGDECSILLVNFGPVGEKNSFKVSKQDKNGI